MPDPTPEVPVAESVYLGFVGEPAQPGLDYPHPEADAPVVLLPPAAPPVV